MPKIRALSIRQPWAELILRKTKKTEIRSRPTKIRGRVYIYAGLKRDAPKQEKAWTKKYKLDLDELTRGVIVGSVEIVGCEKRGRDYHWLLRAPKRAKRFRRPKRQPQPSFFWPD